ncbi:hypothetical protein AL755_19380 [Arthrobacter sp. ERGS1:01]|uniref:Ig domain-containing protein n=1 Tax=Arthrobacter sp. ERGS1:01 TaxID=1704044 RepID=UPI0006B598EC|nr:Ig domain-containing protein [Arthrobacter sp. ERGS1:01]ALE07129.1 hypothetical protein AL755_19380 [Arthrobacter sp. ERGS1:01]
MLRWHLPKSILAVCAAALLVVGGSALTAAPAQAEVSATVAVQITAGQQVNQPLDNSGCYPSGTAGSYQVVTFRTTTSASGSFRAAVAAGNGALVAALYEGAFTPSNTVAHCVKRAAGAAAGQTATLNWGAPASSDPATAKTWSLVLFASASDTAPVGATVSLTSNGTVSIEGQPLTLQGGGLGSANQGEGFEAGFTSVNGTPPYKYSASGLPGGLSIDAGTGAVSGTPTESGTFDPVITVTDSAPTPASTSRTMPLDVVAAQTPTPTATPTAEPSSSPETTTSTPETSSAAPETTTAAPETTTAAPETTTAAPETTTATPETSAAAPETSSAAPETTMPTTAPGKLPSVSATTEGAAPAASATTAPSETRAPSATKATVGAVPGQAGEARGLPNTGAAVVLVGTAGAAILGTGILVFAASRKRRARHG